MLSTHSGETDLLRTACCIVLDRQGSDPHSQRRGRELHHDRATRVRRQAGSAIVRLRVVACHRNACNAERALTSIGKLHGFGFARSTHLLIAKVHGGRVQVHHGCENGLGNGDGIVRIELAIAGVGGCDAMGAATQTAGPENSLTVDKPHAA